MYGPRREPTNEPTLMMGDLDLEIDCNLLNEIVCNTFPHPQFVRTGLTKSSKQNVFYQYGSFEDARAVWRLLSGLEVPEIQPGFRLDLTFTMQKDEVCAYLNVPNVHLNRFEIYTILAKYPSILGLSHWQFVQTDDGCVRTTCFVRFGDPEDCMQAVVDLRGVPIENSRVIATISVRHIDNLKEYVQDRENLKQAVGLPCYHNFYEKRLVDRDEFNRMTIENSDSFADLEGSRWSPVAFRTDVYDMDYNRQLTLDYFQNIF